MAYVPYVPVGSTGLLTSVSEILRVVGSASETVTGTEEEAMNKYGYRLFWLENEKGECISLNGDHEFILINPTGLGWTSGVEHANLKHGFFTPSTEDTPEQGSVVGDLLFHGDDPYTQYRFFADWVLKAKELYLLYMPRTTLYRRRVSLSYLTKTEKTTQNVLVVPVAFAPLTPWYIPSEGEGFSAIEDTGTAFIMDESLLDIDVFGIDGANERYMIYTTHGQTPASIKITIQGPISDPVITVISETDTSIVYGSCPVAVSLRDTETFEYSTEPGNRYVRVRRTGASDSTSVLDLVTDLSHEIYPTIPVGETVRIVVTSGSGITGEIEITVQDYLKGV